MAGLDETRHARLTDPEPFGASPAPLLRHRTAVERREPVGQPPHIREHLDSKWDSIRESAGVLSAGTRSAARMRLWSFRQPA